LSKWLAGSSILSILSGNLFVIVVGSLLGAAEVGALRAAQNLFGAVGMLSQGLQNVVPIQAARRLAGGGIASLVSYLRFAAMVTGGLAMVISMVIWAAPEFWLRLFYGPGFAGYGYLLVWYSLIFILLTLELPLSAGLRALEATRPDFVAYAAGIAFASAAALPFIKLFGLTGAVLGLLLTWVIRTIVMAMGVNLSVRRALADRA
jgi:O-antigen/teichoic acid export membrane protein